MINKKINKLMVFIAMSFVVSSPLAQAEDKEVAKEVVKETKTEITTATSREIHKHALGLGLGQTFVYGQFHTHGDDKITVDLLYSYTASYSFDLLVDVHFSDHSNGSKKLSLNGYTMSIKSRVYEFDAFSPYILGGVGFYSPTIKDKNGDTSEKKTAFGFNLGAGADLRLNEKFVIGLMAQYHKPFEIQQDETDDVSGSYVKLLLTGMYQF